MVDDPKKGHQNFLGMKRRRKLGDKVVGSWDSGKNMGKYGDLGSMTKKRSLEFSRDEMGNFGEF